MVKEYRPGTFDRRVAYGQRQRKLMLVSRGIISGFKVNCRSAKEAENLYLATDPDREGEAISWHLYELLKERGATEGKHVSRVVFHEITKNAVKHDVPTW